MRITPTVTFRRIRRSPDLEAKIYEAIDRLETFCPSITSCRVLVELAQRHHKRGNRCHVRIDLTLPGEEIVVAHEASLRAAARAIEADRITKREESDPERKHLGVAVRKAFDVARRRLQDYARRQRGAVKTSRRPPRGRVILLFPVDEFGYIQAEDGHDVYFQKTSVLGGGFDRLAVGSAVSFVEEAGEKGPQASTVRPLRGTELT
jgi:cold shock CspA family protein